MAGRHRCKLGTVTFVVVIVLSTDFFVCFHGVVMIVRLQQHVVCSIGKCPAWHFGRHGWQSGCGQRQ